MYQQRLEEEERLKAEERLKRRQNEELKYKKESIDCNQSVSPNRLSPTPNETMVGVKTTPERPQNLKSDNFIKDAGLSRTGIVGRKSSREKLLGTSTFTTASVYFRFVRDSCICTIC